MLFLPAPGFAQDAIDQGRIKDMLKWTPRRSRLSTDWPDALYPPDEGGQNWRLVLPFQESFVNCFRQMCSDVDHYVHISKKNRCCIFLNDSQWNEESVKQAQSWVKTTGRYVAIRDCLALSFALDYRTEGGDPNKPRTQVGDLCRRAKPYGANETYDRDAAKELAKLCAGFLKEMTCYDLADCIVSMPPSRPDKPFDLPEFLAGHIASAIKKPHLADAIQTVKSRRQLKAVSLKDKLKVLSGTVRVDPKAFKDKNVLIVDDLYQSGTSVNYVAMLLQQSGARSISAVACEKTAGNADNVDEQDSE